DGNGFEHRAVAETPSTDVIDLPAARFFEEFVKSLYQVGAVNVVSHLFFLVTKNGVRRACNRALHQVGEEAVKLGAGVSGARETTSTEAGCFHAEVTAVFLNEHIGGDFGCAEQAVRGVVDGHGFGNAVFCIRMARIEFPACSLLDEGQVIGGVAVDLVGGGKNEHGVVSKFPRGFEQNGGSVGIDGKIQGRIAGGPIVRWLRCSVNDERDVAAVALKHAVDGGRVANIDFVVAVGREVASQLVTD